MKKYLGIELGSTRIKAVKIDENFLPVSSGDYTWASKFENGVWTYELDEAFEGIKIALSGVENKDDVCAVGISGMMHGLLAFDKDWNLLTPFRTWQNTITAEAAEKLTAAFGFNIPQRWSIAHLYQAILSGEKFVPKIAHITTLAGYVHFLLTGENVVGLCEASGIFPIDCHNLCYDKEMARKFNQLIAPYNFDFTLETVLPKALPAGETAGRLTKKGEELLDGMLKEGTPFAAPEGDGGTGMVATNSVKVKTGNVSAGTSIFAMVVMEDYLKKVYTEIDLVTTPAGKPVAMVHCNNCTNDSNAWVSVLKETANLFGAEPTTGELYTKLYEKALEGDKDCGGVLTCNYMAGEGITALDSGRPFVLRKQNAKFTLANLFRSFLYSTVATLKLGMEILEGEKVEITSLNGHGGLFKTKGVGQKFMAAALDTSVTCMETAGEGGAYGMALLAAFIFRDKSLEAFLSEDVFKNSASITLAPEAEDVKGFNAYMEDYKKMLEVEKTAVDVL